jgi:hypothetical protein
MPSALDRERKLALMASARSDFAPRANFPPLRQVAPKGIAVLIVNVPIGVSAKRAHAADRWSVAPDAATRVIAVASPLRAAVRARRTISRTVAHRAPWWARCFGILARRWVGRFWVIHFLR